MAEATFLDFFVQYGAFALLFVWLFWETRRDSRAREDRLLGQVDKLNDSFLQIAKILENMETRLNIIENKIIEESAIESKILENQFNKDK